MVWSRVEMIFLLVRQLGSKAAHYCTSPWVTWWYYYYLHNPPLFTHPQRLAPLIIGGVGKFASLAFQT